MLRNMLRQSQLIGPFGPGSFVDLPTRSVIIAGLQDWNKRIEDQVHDPRLIEKLSRAFPSVTNLQLFAPPPFDDAPDAPKLGVEARIFPTWFVTQEPAANAGVYKRRRLVPLGRTTDHGLSYQDPDDGKKKSLTPIRFVRACSKGHTNDVDWRVFVHRGDEGCERTLWIEERGTSGEVADTSIGCDCGKERQLYEALDLASQPLGWCDGSRPWLGHFAKEADCGQPNRLLVRSASNAYFAEVMSTISLPDPDEELAATLGVIVDRIKNVESVSELNTLKKLQPEVAAALTEFSDDRVLEFLARRREGSAANPSVKSAEFEVLTSGLEGRDDPNSNYFARTLDRHEWDPDADELLAGLDRVVLVHRLREVVAQIGFTRFEAASVDIQGELDMQVKRQALATELTWLPAIEHRGEGVFLQISRSAIRDWVARPGVKQHVDELRAGYASWAAERKVDRPFPGAPYVLLHSLSHLLIAAIAMECGYPATSLRERVFAVEEGFGILIHTGSSDSEGTLGGLVQAGYHIREHLHHAVASGELCSNDPVCADHNADDQNERRFLHGAACHGCLLIAEPSCEQRNDFLDRALVVPTVRTRDAAFFRANQG